MCSLYLGDQIISGQATLIGESRNIGQIIPSTIPLTDAGLHLLDGARISGDGIYSAFVDYIAELYGDGTNIPSYFCTEAQWQTAVTTYGVCGKFVYDSVNNTVRLPKVTGIIEGTTDVSALGDLVEAGLPNITGDTYMASWDQFSGTAFYTEGGRGLGYNDATAYNVYFDASRSSSIYGNSSTVQPQTIKAFYYIVIATSTKTDIQVDIDEVATDLNGKADTDLSNVPASKGILTESYVNGTSWYRVYSDGWCEQGGVYTSGNTLTFIKPFKDTNYNIQAKPINWHAGGIALCAVKTSTTYATLYYGWSSNNSQFNGWWNSTDWQACGYIR